MREFIWFAIGYSMCLLVSDIVLIEKLKDELEALVGSARKGTVDGSSR